MAIAAVLVTRLLRKRSRAARTAKRSSMFEAWQTAPATDAYEKPYPMTQAATTGYSDGGFYGDSGYDATPEYATEQYPAAYPQDAYAPGFDSAAGMAGAGAGVSDVGAGMAGAGAGDAAYHSAAYPAAAGAAGVGAGLAAAGGVMAAGAANDSSAPAHTGSAVAAASGLHDGMMTRVKVGFVRSLEDELGECIHQ